MIEDDLLHELRAVAAQVASEHSRQRGAAARGALDDITAATLALLPRWTPAIAERLGVTLGDIELLASQKHVSRFGRGSDVHYIPCDSWRSTVLGSLAESRVRNGVLATLQSAALPESGLPPVLERWAALASGGSAHHAAEQLRDQVERLAVHVDPDAGVDQLEDRADELLAWVDAARTLNLLFEALNDDVLHVAIDRAERSAGLLRRRARDKACLDSYQVRREQDDELARMLEDPGRWCLHFIGVGGTGKTMFVRHLVAHLAPRHGVAIARIDFDHLSPDYPFKDPSRLYEALAAELRGWASEDAERALRSMRGLFGKLRDELHSVSQIDPVAHPLFVEASMIFRDFVRRVASGRPIVFVLDTCEELAKYRIDDRPSPALAKTFEIIELLRYGRPLSDAERMRQGAPPPVLPELRVVLAGRRILAAHGHNYDARSPQPPRGYVWLYEVRGFTRDEALAYLRAARVPREYDEAILGASPEVADALPITWSQARPSSQVPRYHPYDLGVLASLATADDPPSVGEIAAAVDEHYVDIRIVRRLQCKPLERILPIIARLGHVDRSLLGSFVAPHELDEVMARLDEQEWTIAEPWGEAPAWSVDPRLLPRLERYCETRPISRADLQAVTARLDAWFAEGDVARFDWQLLDAGLRMRAIRSGRAGRPGTAPDPEDALAELWRWWLPIEQRLFHKRGVDWTADLLDKLLTRGLPGRADRVEARWARTVVVASLVCAMPRTDHTALQELSEELSGLVTAHTITPLRIRAFAARPTGATVLDEALTTAPGALDVTTEYAILATVAQEYLSGLPTPAWRPLLELVAADPDRLADPDDRLDLGILRTYVTAGLSAAEGDAAGCERALLALRMVPTGARPRPHAVFSGLDVEHLLRVAVATWFRSWGGDLERWREAARTLKARDDLQALTSSVDLELGPVDSDRLAEIIGLHERLHAAQRERETTQLAVQAAEMAQNAEPMVGRSATRRDRPWVWGSTIVLAEALALTGRVSRARELLEDIQQLGGLAGLESARMHAWLIRAFRLWDAGVKPAQQLRESANVGDVGLVALIDGLSGAHEALPARPADDAMVHAIWRSLPAITDDERAAAIAWWNEPGAATQAAEPRAGARERRTLATVLDAVEHRLLANRPRAAGRRDIELPELPVEAAADWVGIAVRGLALDVLPARPTRDWLDRAARRMGTRRVAEIALVEGEALALRLPERARILFDLAATYFASALDALGEVRAGIARVLLGQDRHAAGDVVLGTAGWRSIAADEPADGLLLPIAGRMRLVEQVAAADRGRVRMAEAPPELANAARAIEIRTVRRWLSFSRKGSGAGSTSADRYEPVARHATPSSGPDYPTPTLRVARRESYGFRDVLGVMVELDWSPSGELPRRLEPRWVKTDESYDRLSADPPVPPSPVPVHVGVEVIVPEHLHSPCWEALFPGRRVRRVPERRGAAPRGAVTLDRMVVAHDAVLPWLLGSRPPEPPAEQRFVTSDPRKARDARLCQLVGNVIEDGRTHSAATLIFDDLSLRSKAPSFVGVSTLHLQLPRTPLFLLQGLPYREGVPRRDSTLRLRAATTRRFAGDLAETGAAVLVVPPLGRRDSLLVVEPVIDELLAARTVRDLEQAAATIAERIRELADEETALDVCLYAAREWRPPT